MPRLNGGQVIARILKEYGVPYVAGIPGHGIWGLMDAFNENESKIPFIQSRASAPLLGQHTKEVLRKTLGYDDRRIAELAEAGAFGKAIPTRGTDE